MTFKQIQKVSEIIDEHFGKITNEAFTYTALIKDVEFTQIPDQDLMSDEVPNSTLWTAFVEGISFIVRVRNESPVSVLITNYNIRESYILRIK